MSFNKMENRIVTSSVIGKHVSKDGKIFLFKCKKIVYRSWI